MRNLILTNTAYGPERDSYPRGTALARRTALVRRSRRDTLRTTTVPVISWMVIRKALKPDQRAPSTTWLCTDDAVLIRSRRMWIHRSRALAEKPAQGRARPGPAALRSPPSELGATPGAVVSMSNMHRFPVPSFCRSHWQILQPGAWTGERRN